MSKLGRRDYDQDIASAARISVASWALIVTLIATVSAWGITTRAHGEKNKEQDTAIAAKQDKETAEKDREALLQAIESIQRDVREIRRTQIQELQHNHGGDK